MTMGETRTDRRPRRRNPGAQAASQAARSERYRKLINPFEPIRIFSDDQVAAMHEAALRILEQIGVRVLLPEARTRFKSAGASVDEADRMVRLDRALVTEALRTAPPSFDIVAPAPHRTVSVAPRHLGVIPVGGPPHVTDTERGKRVGTLEDFCNFTKLSQSFDVIHFLGACMEPQEIPIEFRHLETMRAQLTLGDKAPFIYSRGAPQVRDCFEMIRINAGMSEAEFEAQPHTYTVINTNSPLQLDIPMSQGIIDFAAAGQLSIITPFTLAGAMAPITLPGALTQAHAEALAGVTLAQIVRAGAPVAYGGFTSNVDMKSGAPAFGTPEYVKAAFGAGQLARHINLPWRSSNVNASNIADAQAAYESEMSLWGAIMGGCNLIIHGAGWLEGGLAASYEKFILDIEMLQMFAELFQPVAFSAEEIGVEAIAEVGPGGHFFGTSHTLGRYEKAFYAPLVSDWRNFGAWSEDGGKTATERAHGLWKKTLREFQPPAKDPAVIEALESFVTRRRTEGGAPPVS
jgi:trimethylamine--corrinoid protein Co-methyltransferase